jgi:hypothetical protein
MIASSTRALIFGSIAVLGACSSSSTDTTADAGGTSTGTTSLPVGAQTPPATNGTDVEAWLTAGSYKTWHCEAAPHAARSPSPHGTNRICSNDLTSGFSGTGERPVGSASVKELYDGTGKTIVGYAVYLKTKAASDGGNTWYWYERVPQSVLADGFGDTTAPKQVCVSCHGAAGSDAAHTPSPGSGDQVYTQVK